MLKFQFKYYQLILCISILNVISINLYSQGWEDQQGEIEDTEVVIEKNIKITLPFAARNFEKIPPQPIPIQPQPLSFDFLSLTPKLTPVNPRLRVVTIKDDEIRKLYGGYVKAGFGNYGTPLINAYLYTKRNDKYSLGAYGSHLSSAKGPKDGKNSASSDSNIGITGKLIGKSSTLTGNVDFIRMGRYFYGYPDGLEVDRDTIQQILNRLKLNLGLKGTVESSPWDYRLNAGFRTISDKFNAAENEFIADGGLNYSINDESQIELGLGYSYITRNDSLINNLSRHLLEIIPAYHFNYERIGFTLGANMALENDTVKGFNKFHFYPDLKGEYQLGEFSIYAGFTGEIQKKTLGSWLLQNQFLDKNVPIFNANNALEFYGGIKGQVSGILGLQFGASVSAIKNMSYLMNDSTDMSRFTIVYDSAKTTVINGFGELSIQKEKSKIWLRADYWSYSGGSIQEPWHKPEFGLTLGTKFNIYDKILISGDFRLLTGIKAYDYQLAQKQSMDPFLGLNFSADYILSKVASIFVQANNVLSSQNAVFYRYPSRKFQVIGGITFSF